MARAVADELQSRESSTCQGDPSDPALAIVRPEVVEPIAAPAQFAQRTYADTGIEAMFQWFIQLSAMLAAVSGGGWISAILVTRQQKDAAKTASEKVARDLLDTSAGTFSSLTSTFAYTFFATSVVLFLVLVMHGLWKRPQSLSGR